MLSVVYVSSYSPRKCGIAEYTENLTQQIDSRRLLKPSSIVALNDPGFSYKYGKKVVLEIEEQDRSNYQRAADEINRSDIDVVNIQHEFGLYGGTWGEYILDFIKRLKKPCVTTMHTTLSPTSQIYKKLENMAVHDRIVREIAEYSSAVVVMTKKAKSILKKDYNAEAEKVRVIGHGCPEMPFIPSNEKKPQLGLDGRIVLSSFGLLGRDKGINDIIMALPEIVKKWPEVLLLVIGQTHPRIILNEGEAYRDQLKELVTRLNLERNVSFQNRFLSQKKLTEYLLATDIYICAHVNKEQLSSGTITYALGAGRAIISTPFYYAKEVLADGRGLLCKFRNAPSIAESVSLLLDNPEQKSRMEKLAYEYSRNLTWPMVAARYKALFEEVSQ